MITSTSNAQIKELAKLQNQDHISRQWCLRIKREIHFFTLHDSDYRDPGSDRSK